MPTSVARKRFPIAGSQPVDLPPVMVCIPDLPHSPAGGPPVIAPKTADREEVAEPTPSSLQAADDERPENAVLHRPRSQRWRRPDAAFWNHWATKTGVGGGLLLLLILVFFVFGRDNSAVPVADMDLPVSPEASAESVASPDISEPGTGQPAAEGSVPSEAVPPRPAIADQRKPSRRTSKRGAPTARPKAVSTVTKPADPATKATKPPFPTAPELGPALTGPETAKAGEPPHADLQDHPFPPPPEIVGTDQPAGSREPSQTTRPSPPVNTAPLGTTPAPAETQTTPDATAGIGGPAIPGGAGAAPLDESGFARPPFAEVPSHREQQRGYPHTGAADQTATWRGPPTDVWRGGAQDTGGHQRVTQQPAPSPYPTTNTPEPYGLTDHRSGPHGQGGTPAIEAAGQPRNSRFGGAAAPAAGSPYPTTNNPSLDYLKSRVAGDPPAFRTSMRQPPAPSAGTAPAGVAPRPGEAQLRGVIEPPSMRPRYE